MAEVRLEEGVAAIFVHAGAGHHSIEHERRYLELCNKAARAAMKVLRDGSGAVEAVETAIVHFENSEFTNSGYGSNLTMSGDVECDATIVDFYGRSGAVGAAPTIKNPIAAARKVYDFAYLRKDITQVPPNLLVGQGAVDFAWNCGLIVVPNELMVSPDSYARWKGWGREIARFEATHPNFRRDDDALRWLRHASRNPFHLASEPYQDETPETSLLQTDSRVSNSMQGSSIDPFDGQLVSAVEYHPSFVPRSDAWAQGAFVHGQSRLDPTAEPYRHDQRLDPTAEPFRHDQRLDPTAEPYRHDQRSSETMVSAFSQLGIDDDVFEGNQMETPNYFNGQYPRDMGWIPARVSNPLVTTFEYPDSPMLNVSTWPNDFDDVSDTVGAIAVDRNGLVAAGSSSGGIGMKHRGRVGPAALVGIGTHVKPAESEDPDRTTVAAICSGTGELIGTTLAASTCASRLFFNHCKKDDGTFEETTEEECLRRFVRKEFELHPSVMGSEVPGVIGIMAVKKTTDSIGFFFVHNSDSFAVAGMASDRENPFCLMSRNREGCISQGGRMFRRFVQPIGNPAPARYENHAQSTNGNQAQSTYEPAQSIDNEPALSTTDESGMSNDGHLGLNTIGSPDPSVNGNPKNANRITRSQSV